MIIRPYNFDKYKNALTKEFALPQTEFEAARSGWEKTYGWSNKSEKGFIWEILNQTANYLSAHCANEIRNIQNLRALYILMRGFLISENKDGTEVQRLINLCDLKKAERNQFKTSVQIIGDRSCEASKRVEGMTVSVEDALAHQPIPYEECTRKHGCICVYGILGDRDLDGILIAK